MYGGPGGYAYLQGGAGGASSHASGNGGLGGFVYINGGTGGTGGASATGGAGGPVNVTGGQATGAGNTNGGGVFVIGGAKANSGTNGNVLLAIDYASTKRGNVGVGIAGFGTSAVGVLGIGNGTEPTTSPADMVQLYSVDLSAGNATLGLRTETAVVTETVTSDRTLSVRINGTTYKICLKS
jgi:hypothetical protein